MYGNGVIKPLKDIYNDDEKLYLNCAQGSSSISQPRVFFCKNGQFLSTDGNISALICSEGEW